LELPYGSKEATVNNNILEVIGGLLITALPCVIFVLIAGGVAFLIYYSYRQEKQRTADLQRVAEELGFEFLPKDDGSFLSNRGSFPLFSQGHSKRLFNLMRGKTKNLTAAIFDYRYTVGSGKNSHTWQQTVAAFQVDSPPLPTFSLRPESVWHKIGALLGYQDINFPHAPVFSKSYLLRGSDETAIRNLFNDQVLLFFEANQGLSVEADQDWLLVYRPNNRAKPEAMRALLEEGLRVLDQIHPARDEF
jgi:hypothetical protein